MATTLPAPAATRGRLDRFAATVAHAVPDAITASVVLLIVLVAGALLIGDAPMKVMDAYYRGLWTLLPFTMQMTLIMVLSSALSQTPLFRKAVARLAAAPASPLTMVALPILLNGIAAYFYWGLSVALAPVIAVFFAQQAEKKGIAIDFPFFLAAITSSTAVYQFGLSSAGPLALATSGHFLQEITGVVPLTRTIWSPAAILQVTLFLTAVILLAWRAMPRDHRPISVYPESAKLAMPEERDLAIAVTYSEQLERKPWFTLVLCAVLAGWLWYHFFVKGAGVDLNVLNTSLFLFSFLLHGNFKSFTRAVEKSIGAVWPVAVLFHLYAGLAGLIQFTHLGERVAGMAAAVSNRYTYPALTAVISTVFAFFIPSSGAQFAIQGFVTAKSAIAVGVSVERGMLALGLGDHMGNFLSPFWWVVAAGIARLDFRAFFGYGLVFGALWFAIGLVVFTFAPC
ncbi:MAG: short-chain fatty acid transporter [Bryobacterales bacterium]|nr:short-chain fatty acid transporter [Bryobacterales bacterium]